MACLRDHQLQAFAHRLAKKQPVDPVQRDHIRGCARCEGELRRYTITDPVNIEAEMADASGVMQAVTPPLEDIDRGIAIGRYVILNKLSQGVSGVVFTAYDPELARRVALKLLRNNVKNLDDATRRARFFRQAQALARVTHPNVITIFDIGNYGPYAFLAMNLVEGQTLSAWLKATQRTPREILSAFEQAGRGLIATHAAGLVHRDFTPDNVLVDQSGDVFVTDFGLARGDGDESQLPQELTGTPRYMAPEQLEGKPADALSDQYSFCASLFGALFGEPPYPGTTVPEIRQRILEKRLASPASRKSVSPKVWKGLLRGLSVDPQARFPSMEALLIGLKTLGRGRRRLYQRAGIAALAALAFGVWVGVATRSSSTAHCEGAQTKFASTWDDNRLNQVRAALTAAPAEYAAETADKVSESLSGYAKQWTAVFTEACLATHERGQQNETLFDMQADCLEKRRREFAAVVQLLADRQVDISHATRAAQALTPPTVCADGAHLQHAQAGATEVKDEGQRAELNTALAKVKALHDTGRFAEALKEALSLLPKVRATNAPQLTAEMTYLTGKLYGSNGNLLAAEPLLLESALTAQAAHADRIGVLALSQLARDTGAGRGLYEEATRYHQQAKALLARVDDDGELAAHLLHDWGATLSAQDRATAAIELFRQALELRARLRGDAHLDTLQTLDALADNLIDIGQIDEALGFLNRAQEARSKLFGKNHPLQTMGFARLGIAYSDAGRDADAEGWFLKAIAHLTSLKQKDLDSAMAVTNYAQFLIRKKDYGGARNAAERALSIKTSLAKDHPRTAINLTQLGDAEEAEGRYEKAIAFHNQALAIKQRAYPKDTRRHVRELTALGKDHLGLKKYAVAITYLEQALAALPETPGTKDQRAEAVMLLASARWNTPKSRTEARASVERALAGLKGLSFSIARPKLEAWLKAHPLSVGSP